ncbi:MAG: 30S ribosomal protein S11 [Deltaproteobacteria bacterium CG11_big_fil_rev_8_21_14_0_20_47_16]|nr:MAG: 30S ribosomal protein S11 [Deltaproteobacteria bacterium CG11_big_fil_rev_8_21_14_0_20_47_16]
MAEEVKETKKEKKAAPVEATEAAAPVKVRVKKGKKNVATGFAHVLATFNNTIITFTDPQGHVLCWSSSGSKGFKGSRKSTPFAAQIAGEEAARKARECGMRSVVVHVKGPGVGRESALRAIANSGIKISYIRDVTAIPHNGCRPPKRRRV